MITLRYINVWLVITTGLVLLAALVSIDTQQRVDAALAENATNIASRLTSSIEISSPQLLTLLEQSDKARALDLIEKSFGNNPSRAAPVPLSLHRANEQQIDDAISTHIVAPIPGPPAATQWLAAYDLSADAQRIRHTLWRPTLLSIALALVIIMGAGVLVSRNLSRTTRRDAPLARKLGEAGPRTEEDQLAPAEDRKQHLSAAIASGGIAVWEWHVESDVFDHLGLWAAPISGTPSDDVRSGQGLLRITHPDDRAVVQRELVRHLKSATEMYEVEQRMRQANGGYRRFLVRGRVTQRSESGRASSVVGTATDVTELREQQQRLELALKFGGQAMYEWHPEQDILTLSDNWYELFSQPPGSIHNVEDFAAVIHHADRDKARKALVNALTGAADHAVEFRVPVGDDGDERWVLVRGVVDQRDASGRATRLLGTMMDITDLKQSQEGLSLALNAVQIGLGEWHPETDRLIFDSSWLELTGWVPGEVSSTAEMVAQGWVHPEDLVAFSAMTNDVRNGRSAAAQAKFRLRTRAGTYRWMLGSIRIAERNADGSAERIIGTILDISEMMSVEERLDLAVTSARQGLWQWLPHGDRLEPMSNWLALTGYEAGELPSMAACYAGGVIPEDDQKLVMTELEALEFGERNEGEIEFRIRRKSGEIFWALTRLVTAERDPDGRAIRIVGVNIDITERRAAEDRLNVALQASRQGTWEWTLDDDRFYPDAHWRELFAPADYDIKTMDDVVQHVIHPDDRSSAGAAASVARKATEDHGQGEFRLRDKQGGFIWVVTRTIITERDLDLMPVRVVGTTIDISHLKEAQTRIRLAAEGSRLGFWEWLPQTDQVIFPDDSWPHLTGLPASRFPNMRESFQLMHPVDRPVVEKAFAQVIANEKETVELNLRLRRDDGSYLSLLTRAQVTERDEHGLVLRMVGTSVDVTELKDAQSALEAARKFLRVVLDTVPESIFWKDTESRYQGGNRRFANDAGFDRPEDVIGLSDDDMPWRDLAIQLRAEDSALLSGHASISQDEQVLDSTALEQMWVSTTKVALPDEDGRAVGVLGVFRDITAYRQTLSDLQAERDRLELVIHGTGVGVWELDVATKQIIVNERAAEILGYTRDELAPFTAQSRLTLVHPDDRTALEAATAKSLEHGRGSYDVDYRIQHKQGRWLWLHDSGRVTARGADDEPLRMTGTIIDITERRERDGHLQTIAEAVTGAHGDGLLQTVVRAARDLTETGTAFVGALNDTGTKVSVIAAWPPDPSLDRLEYDLDLSPCAKVLEEDICVYAQQVTGQFPHDELLREMNIESYAGRRLTDEAGHPHGVFVLLDTKPFTQIERIRSVLDILSSTASNELERERRNSALRDSETRYRQTYERMPMLLCTIDQQNSVVDVNEAWSRATGRSRDACLGQTLDAFFTLQSNATLSAALLSNASVTHSDGEYLMLNSSDGPTLTTEYTLFGAGHVSGTDYRILALEDVTAQLRAEEQLRIAATAFETHGAIAIADRECHILQINEAFTELTQYPQTEMVGCLPEVLKSDRHKDPFYQDIWYEVGQFGRWEGEMWGRRKDGSEFPMWQAITAVYDDAREVSHYVINMLDITDRVRAEREIERLAFFDSLTGLANRRYLLAISTGRRNTFFKFLCRRMKTQRLPGSLIDSPRDFVQVNLRVYRQVGSLGEVLS